MAVDNITFEWYWRLCRNKREEGDWWGDWWVNASTDSEQAKAEAEDKRGYERLAAPPEKPVPIPRAGKSTLKLKITCSHGPDLPYDINDVFDGREHWHHEIRHVPSAARVKLTLSTPNKRILYEEEVCAMPSIRFFYGAGGTQGLQGDLRTYQRGDNIDVVDIADREAWLKGRGCTVKLEPLIIRNVGGEPVSTVRELQESVLVFHGHGLPEGIFAWSRPEDWDNRRFRIVHYEDLAELLNAPECAVNNLILTLCTSALLGKAASIRGINTLAYVGKPNSEYANELQKTLFEYFVKAGNVVSGLKKAFEATLRDYDEKGWPNDEGLRSVRFYSSRPRVLVVRKVVSDERDTERIDVARVFSNAPAPWDSWAADKGDAHVRTLALNQVRRTGRFMQVQIVLILDTCHLEDAQRTDLIRALTEFPTVIFAGNTHSLAGSLQSARHDVQVVPTSTERERIIQRTSVLPDVEADVLQALVQASKPFDEVDECVRLMWDDGLLELKKIERQQSIERQQRIARKKMIEGLQCPTS